MEFVARARSLSPTLPCDAGEGANESLREFYIAGRVDDQQALFAQDARRAVPSETRDEAFADAKLNLINPLLIQYMLSKIVVMLST